MDTLAAVTCILSGLLIIALSAVIGINQYGVGLAFSVPALVYILISDTELGEGDFSGDYRYASIGFFVLLGVGTLIGAVAEYDRPLLHFILLSLAASTLAFDIRSSERGVLVTSLSLFKIVLLAVAFRAVRFTNFPTIPGNDTHFHYHLASMISFSGTIPSGTEVASKYVITPLWHLYVATFEIITGTGFEYTFIFALIVPFAIITVFSAYAIGHRLTGIYGVAIATGLLIAIADMFTRRGATSIGPPTVVISLILLVLLLIFGGKDRRNQAIIALLLAVAILTHHLSTFALLVIIGSLAGVSILYHISPASDSQPFKTIPISTVFVAGLLLYVHWTYATVGGSNLFEPFVGRLLSAVTRLLNPGNTGGAYATAFEQQGVLSNVLYSLGQNALLAAGIFGILYFSAHQRWNWHVVGLAAPATVLFMLIYPGTLFGLDLIFIPHRLIVFLQIFLILFGAVGLVVVSRSRRITRQNIVLGSILALLALALLTAPYLNHNTPLYTEDRVDRADYTEREVSIHFWAIEHSDSAVYTDPRISDRKITTEVLRAGIENNPQNAYETTYIRRYSGESADEFDSLYVVRGFARENKRANLGGFARSSTSELEELIRSSGEDSKIYTNGQDSTYIR